MCEFETPGQMLPLISKKYPKSYPAERNGKRRTTTDGQQQSKVTESGKPYIRNICMAFDLHLKRKAPETALFSMTI
jgi:oxygen-independent coproporphyrinogen-3 oxidase